MATVSQRATLDDLYRTPGKAELIGGRIVHYMATEVRPNEVAANIFVSLRAYVAKVGKGKVFTDNMGFAIPKLPSGRESFSPDASYYDGPLPANLMRFVEGPPTFAVEVRSENDYTPSAEAQIAAKRADYFTAGTPVIWDVDPVAKTITCYRTSDPTQPVTWQRGDTAEAEPAVPGWRVAVDEVFAGKTKGGTMSNKERAIALIPKLPEQPQELEWPADEWMALVVKGLKQELSDPREDIYEYECP
jgi:Uma2 family endonuclease